MSEVEVEELTQEQYNAGRESGEIDENGERDEEELNDTPDTFVKPEAPPAVTDPPPEAAPKRPWQKGDEDGTQGGIPNARFAATRIELREKDHALAEARAQLAALQKPVEQEITNPDQIDRSKFIGQDGEFDGPAYLAAREAIVRKQAVAEIRTEIQQKEQQRQNDALVGSYIAAVQEEAKSNPEIIAAVQHLDQYGPMMHPAVAATLLKMPPAVSFAVACDERYIAQLVNGNPVDSLALLGELKAMSKAQPAKAAQVTTPSAPAAFKPQAQAKPVPRTVGGGGGGARKDPEQMTQEEYNAYRLRQNRE